MTTGPLKVASPSRRRLLRAAAATGVLAAFDRQLALAQSAPDYKALVCVYLQGGNDGENTLIRYDGAGYQNYASIRPVPSGLNIPQASLLPIQPANVGFPFGFHPACSALKPLFDGGKLAVVANMGALVGPVTRSTLSNGTARLPANLFSHTDQELAVQSADSTGVSHVGWGGRIADRLDTYNQGSAFPPLISTQGLRTFASGLASVPLTVPEGADSFNLAASSALEEAALRVMVARKRSNVYEAAAQLYAQEGLSAASVLAPIFRSSNTSSVVTPAFANLSTSIGRQMRNAAQLIEARQQIGLKRQVFYVHQAGYDTHGSQAGIHQQLLGDFSASVGAFQNAMKALGLENNVTLFTLSDFGRTLKPASNAGTDHGWGNYAFVIGGAVRGGSFYGKVPTPALNGPDDFSDACRWIPTTSIEQYGATLARWFGIAEGDLAYVFPNIGAFANTNLGFMS